MPLHLVTVEHRETDEDVRSKVECLERELRRSADWQVPGPARAVHAPAESVGRALEAVDRAIEKCGYVDDLIRLEPG